MNATNSPKKAIGYCRVSTQEQGASRNGLESQQRDIANFCAAHEIQLIECVVEVASGASNMDKRHILASVVARCKAEGCILMTSKLDRFSRDMEFVATMLNEFTRKHVKFVSCQQGLNADLFTLHIYASLAQREREDISQRTKKGLESVKARGGVLGFADHKDGGKAFFAARCAGRDAIAKQADEFANKLRPIIEPMRKQGMSLEKIANSLNMHQTPTAKGGKWSITSVQRITQRWA